MVTRRTYQKKNLRLGGKNKAWEVTPGERKYVEKRGALSRTLSDRVVRREERLKRILRNGKR